MGYHLNKVSAYSVPFSFLSCLLSPVRSNCYSNRTGKEMWPIETHTGDHLSSSTWKGKGKGKGKG